MARGQKNNAGPSSSQKCKPGRKGNFHGKRLELLESFLPDWERARINRTTGDFWSVVTAAYWRQFPWRLQQNEDSSVEPSGDAADATGATDEPNQSLDDNLTAEELKLKTTAIKLVEGVRVFFGT
jgi:hypothetical protein